MTDSDPAASGLPQPPPAAPPPPAPPPVTPPGRGTFASAEHSAAAAEKQATQALNVSGADSLILAGAALYLIVGELFFGALLGGGSTASFVVLGGLSLAGVLSGEVLFFLYFTGPRGNRPGLLAAKTVQVIVAALVVAIVLYAVSDLIAVIRDLGGFFNLGLFGILLEVCRVIGAALMALGVAAVWSPMTAPGTTPAKR